MALKDVKDRIKAQMETVTNIGLVYTRHLLVRTAEEEKTKLVSGGRINVWLISRESSSLKDENVNQALQERGDAILIRGFYALDDDDTNPSEAAFEALVDAIVSRLNTDRQPASKLGATVVAAEPPFLRLSDHRHYGPSQALCHHAEIILPVKLDYLQ